MGIRYAELTVPLVKAVQEVNGQNQAQDTQIEALKAQNEALTKELQAVKEMLAQFGTDLQSCCLKASDNNAKSFAPALTDGVALEQNIPNPFNQTTTIQYYLPKNVQNATLQVSDLNGKVIQSIVLNDRGAASVTIDAAPFSNGTYFYSLLVDGKAFATKKMVIAGQ